MVRMLGAENVIMEVRNPLLTRSSRVQVGYCCTYLLEYTIPEKSWILVQMRLIARLFRPSLRAGLLPFARCTLAHVSDLKCHDTFIRTIWAVFHARWPAGIHTLLEKLFPSHWLPSRI